MISFSREFLKNLFYHPLFWLGLAIKILLICYMSDIFLDRFFVPFLKYFIVNFSNPYKYFAENNQWDIFPYPALMLYIMTLPGYFLSKIGVDGSFIYRIPLFFADFVLLLVLSSWLRTKIRNVLLYYWLSPVLLYINYIHGQLDVIPISLLFISLYFLFKKYHLAASSFLAMAIATKTSVLIVLPLYLIYLYQEDGDLLKILKQLLIIIAVTLGFNLQFIDSNHYLKMVYANAEQNKLFAAVIPFHHLNLSLYIIPLAYLLLLMKAISMKVPNRNIYVMFLGIAFGSLTLFIPPQHGWYYWLLPFLGYFYMKANLQEGMLFFMLQIAYFCYFAVIPDSDISLKIYGFDSKFILNLAFTVLQSLLLLNCIWVYSKGIRLFKQQKFISKPFLIGIGGNSGAGKTTISDSLMAVFSKNHTSVIKGDDVHKWERGDEKWQKFTHLDPKANNIHQELRYLKALKTGSAIKRSMYNHSTGKFDRKTRIHSGKTIIYEGLHPFYIKAIRDVFDLRVYIKPDEDLYVHWKVLRDITKRGYSKEQVLQQIKKRQKDYEKYIAVQEKFADIVISIHTKEKIKKIGDNKIKPKIYLEIRFANNIDITDLLNILGSQKNLKIEHNYDEEDSQTLIIDGVVTGEFVEHAANQLVITDLEEIGINYSQWQGDYVGVMQLFLVYCILYMVKNNHE